MTGLIIALAREIPPGFVRTESAYPQKSFSLPLYQFSTPSHPLVAVRTGVGRIRAAAGARLLIQQFSPHLLVSFGFAGGLSPDLAPGTLVIGDRVVLEDSPVPLYTADCGVVAQMLEAANAAGLPVRRGAVVAVNGLVPDGPSKAALARSSGASVVDMETAGIAEVAHGAGLAWVAVRAIVDTVDERLPVECLTALHADGRVAVGRLVHSIWRSPGMVRDFLWLARRTATARRHLSRVLQHWARDVTPRLSNPHPPQIPSPLGRG